MQRNTPGGGFENGSCVLQTKIEEVSSTGHRAHHWADGCDLACWLAH